MKGRRKEGRKEGRILLFFFPVYDCKHPEMVDFDKLSLVFSPAGQLCGFRYVAGDLKDLGFLGLKEGKATGGREGMGVQAIGFSSQKLNHKKKGVSKSLHPYRFLPFRDVVFPYHDVSSAETK